MSEYKKIQAELLKIYKEIKQLCDKNNIRCFAVGGTMLGAVRHNGFIPWDDDMDLGIPVDDFDKFRKACKKELREPYEFKDLLWIGGKVHNKQTSFIETPCAINRENGYGIFVDIFPIIGTPNSSEERLDFLNNMLLYSFQAMFLIDIQIFLNIRSNSLSNGAEIFYINIKLRILNGWRNFLLGIVLRMTQKD